MPKQKHGNNGKPKNLEARIELAKHRAGRDGVAAARQIVRDHDATVIALAYLLTRAKPSMTGAQLRMMYRIREHEGERAAIQYERECLRGDG